MVAIAALLVGVDGCANNTPFGVCLNPAIGGQWNHMDADLTARATYPNLATTEVSKNMVDAHVNLQTAQSELQWLEGRDSWLSPTDPKYIHGHKQRIKQLDRVYQKAKVAYYEESLQNMSEQEAQNRVDTLANNPPIAQQQVTQAAQAAHAAQAAQQAKQDAAQIAQQQAAQQQAAQQAKQDAAQIAQQAKQDAAQIAQQQVAQVAQQVEQEAAQVAQQAEQEAAQQAEQKAAQVAEVAAQVAEGVKISNEHNVAQGQSGVKEFNLLSQELGDGVGSQNMEQVAKNSGDACTNYLQLIRDYKSLRTPMQEDLTAVTAALKNYQINSKVAMRFLAHAGGKLTEGLSSVIRLRQTEIASINRATLMASNVHYVRNLTPSQDEKTRHELHKKVAHQMQLTYENSINYANAIQYPTLDTSLSNPYGVNVNQYIETTKAVEQEVTNLLTQATKTASEIQDTVDNIHVAEADEVRDNHGFFENIGRIFYAPVTPEALKKTLAVQITEHETLLGKIDTLQATLTKTNHQAAHDFMQRITRVVQEEGESSAEHQVLNVLRADVDDPFPGLYNYAKGPKGPKGSAGPAGPAEAPAGSAGSAEAPPPGGPPPESGAAASPPGESSAEHQVLNVLRGDRDTCPANGTCSSSSTFLSLFVTPQQCDAQETCSAPGGGGASASPPGGAPSEPGEPGPEPLDSAMYANLLTMGNMGSMGALAAAKLIQTMAKSGRLDTVVELGKRALAYPIGRVKHAYKIATDAVKSVKEAWSLWGEITDNSGKLSIGAAAIAMAQHEAKRRGLLPKNINTKTMVDTYAKTTNAWDKWAEAKRSHTKTIAKSRSRARPRRRAKSKAIAKSRSRARSRRRAKSKTISKSRSRAAGRRSRRRY